MGYDDDKLTELLRIVAGTESVEIDCERFLERAAAWLDTLGPHDEVPAEFRDVAQHVLICGECREEYEALLDLLHGRTGRSCL